MRKAFIILFMVVFAAGCGKSPTGGVATGGKIDVAENASLTVSPAEKSITIQQIYPLKASVALRDGYKEEITEYANWTSSNEAVATVSNQEGSRGVLTAVSPGNVIVTARFNNLFSTARISITHINQGPMASDARVVFLHHSTGGCIWSAGVPAWFAGYNAQQGKSYSITDQEFPKRSPYGWNNYPYDYWNIWVRHAGPQPYMEEPTLEILTRTYNVIVWKHCFPVSTILPDMGAGSVQSSEKRIENYKLQYLALRSKMRSFPSTRFIVWTGAALAQGVTNESQALLARTFFTWVKTEWDQPGDNIYVWDFFEHETEGGNYLKGAYAVSASDSHPNAAFSKKVAADFCKRVVDVIEGRGDPAPPQSPPLSATGLSPKGKPATAAGPASPEGKPSAGIVQGPATTESLSVPSPPPPDRNGNSQGQASPPE